MAKINNVRNDNENDDYYLKKNCKGKKEEELNNQHFEDGIARIKKENRVCMLFFLSFQRETEKQM